MLELNGVPVADSFAEAFPMTGTRLVVTADTIEWARTAATVATGNATSVIACDCEAGIEREIPTEETPDGRPGFAVLMFGFSRSRLAEAAINRVGQSVLTCPTTACFDGLPEGETERRIPLAKQLRFFGDGFQISKKIGNRRLWRIPVMDGEFVCDDTIGTQKGVAGGNLLIGGLDPASALAAATRAVSAINALPDVITPFPGGIVRSGSKVGSRYKKLKASTNDAYCPSLRAQVPSELLPQTEAMYEIVIDGLSEDAVREAMRAGLHAAVKGEGVTQIGAGNYGGKLGEFHFHLRELL